MKINIKWQYPLKPNIPSFHYSIIPDVNIRKGINKCTVLFPLGGIPLDDLPDGVFYNTDQLFGIKGLFDKGHRVLDRVVTVNAADNDDRCVP